MFTSSKRKAILITLLVLAMWAFATNYGYCQEMNRASIDAQGVLWADQKETFLDASGNATAEYDYRMAPLTGKFAVGITDSISLMGNVMYSRIYSIQDPPSWAFSPNSAGQVVDLEGGLIYGVTEAVHIRGGVSFMNLERTMNVYQAGTYQGRSVTTTHTAPFIGGGFGFDDNVIANANLEYYPFIAVRDSYSPYANSGSTSNFGYRMNANLGFRFTDNLALIGGVDLKQVKTRDGADGADSHHQIFRRMFTAGLHFSF